MLSLSVHIHHCLYPVSSNLHFASAFLIKIINLLGQGSISQHLLNSLDHEKLLFRGASHNRDGRVEDSWPETPCGKELISLLFH